MKRINRVSNIILTLTETPNKIYPFAYFMEKFDCAKSSLSEDISHVKNIINDRGVGKIVIVHGPNGGVKLVPFYDQTHIEHIQNEIITRLADKSRILGGGFVYNSDLMFDPVLSRKIGAFFAMKFLESGAEYVVTIETKGVPIALTVAQQLNLPTIVVRRETKISEGPTMSISYFSGTTNKMQKMSIAKKAVKRGSKAIIIDDFMREGGSIKGIIQLLSEFDMEVAGIGIAVTTAVPKCKKIDNYIPLVYLHEIEEETGIIKLTPNFQIF